MVAKFFMTPNYSDFVRGFSFYHSQINIYVTLWNCSIARALSEPLATYSVWHVNIWNLNLFTSTEIYWIFYILRETIDKDVKHLISKLQCVVMSDFICHFYFTWNQFWGFWESKNWHFGSFRCSEFWILVTFSFLKLQKFIKMAVFGACRITKIDFT